MVAATIVTSQLLKRNTLPYSAIAVVVITATRSNPWVKECRSFDCAKPGVTFPLCKYSSTTLT